MRKDLFLELTGWEDTEPLNFRGVQAHAGSRTPSSINTSTKRMEMDARRPTAPNPVVRTDTDYLAQIARDTRTIRTVVIWIFLLLVVSIIVFASVGTSIDNDITNLPQNLNVSGMTVTSSNA